MNISLIETRKLEELFKAWELLSSSLSYEEILNITLTQVCKLLNAEAASIFLWDAMENELFLKTSTNLSPEEARKIRVPLGKGIVGYVAHSGVHLNIVDAAKDERFYKDIDKLTGFQTKAILTVPLKVEDKLVGAVQLINKNDGTSFTEEDIALLIQFSRLTSIIFDKAQMHEEILQKRLIEYDLSLAHSLQMKLLPSQPLQKYGITVEGYYKAAKFVGGDYFDYVAMPGEKVFFTIGDISGKGPDASLLMSGVKAFLYAYLQMDKNVEEIALNLNRYFEENSPAEKFLTVFMGIFDRATSRIVYVNAGHESPILMKKNGELRMLEANCLILGAFSFWQSTITEIAFEPGDVILAYTDGISEAMNESDELFGYERIDRFMEEHIGKPETIVKDLPPAVKAHCGNAQQSDDISFLVIYREA